MEMNIIAHIHSDFDTKFGIPRQSGIVDELESTIVFEPEYRNAEALRGLDGFSHIWLIWQFSEAVRDKWSPTVRPPRLGGNKRIGVFATRSPFRPNSIGLSSVRLGKIEYTGESGPVIHVFGADLMDGTPILDIKPYLPFTDSHPNASSGFAEQTKGYSLDVEFPEELIGVLPEDKRSGAVGILAHDPRPSYQSDETRVYGVNYAGCNIRFTVSGNLLKVISVDPIK